MPSCSTLAAASMCASPPAMHRTRAAPQPPTVCATLPARWRDAGEHVVRRRQRPPRAAPRPSRPEAVNGPRGMWRSYVRDLARGSARRKMAKRSFDYRVCVSRA
eukprot:5979016-Prymnesium_polylepis.1